MTAGQRIELVAHERVDYKEQMRLRDEADVYIAKLRLQAHFDKESATELYDEVNAALKELAARHGLKVSVKGRTYHDHDFPLKVEFSSDLAAAMEFAQDAWQFGLAPTDYGREFTWPGGRRIRITGIKPRATKMPVTGVDLGNGRGCSMDAKTVLAALAAEG